MTMTTGTMKPAAQKRIDRDFVLRLPSPQQVQQAAQIWSKAKEMAVTINLLCPESRELAVAQTALEECADWAIKALVRPPKDEPAKVPPLDMTPGRTQSRQPGREGEGDLGLVADRTSGSLRVKDEVSDPELVTAGQWACERSDLEQSEA